MKKICKEIIDFLKNENGWDKQEIINEYVTEILKEYGSELIYADELTISDGEKSIATLDQFANDFWNKVIDGVCNVVKTA